MTDTWADWSSTAGSNTPVGTDTPDDLHVQLQNIKAQVKENCADIPYVDSYVAGLVQHGFGYSRLKVYNNLGAPNTSIDITADAISVNDGTTYKTIESISQTINFTTTGANALDTGAIAANTWYHIFEIAKPDGTAAALGSLSATVPTMPADYTLKKRIGAVLTNSTGIIYRYKQIGNEVFISVGVNPTTPIVMGYGNAGNTDTPTWVAIAVGAFIPPTATHIILTAWTSISGAIGVAPNANYGAQGSATNKPPVLGTIQHFGSQPYSMMLESSSIYWYSGNSGDGGVSCTGWIDDI